MADQSSDDSLYPIAVLIDELRNEDVQVWSFKHLCTFFIHDLKITGKCKEFLKRGSNLFLKKVELAQATPVGIQNIEHKKYLLF